MFCLQLEGNGTTVVEHLRLSTASAEVIWKQIALPSDGNGEMNWQL